jgi:3-oxoacyl-(acyl-carrier-protein) synthase
MSLGIAGMGWITPLGGGVASVWERLLAGESAKAEAICDSLGQTTYFAYRVPTSSLSDTPTHARLRRSSAISRFAVGAGLEALNNSGWKLDEIDAKRLALIFAISNGGVIYTKRFYHDIVESGAQTASPLLFPETVFNAPASHLAAILGITGASYTLVGDGAVGILAVKMAEDLMEADTVDHCLVVGAEETDWLLCDAYRKWRLLRSEPPIEAFGTRARGMILSEGAGAILLSRKASIQIEQVLSGRNFVRRKDAAAGLRKLFADFKGDAGAELVIASANGTFIDVAERTAILERFPDALVYTPKPALGESVAAGSLWQVICAAKALSDQQLPPVLNVAEDNGVRINRRRLDNLKMRRALVSVCGLNQQFAGMKLSV